MRPCYQGKNGIPSNWIHFALLKTNCIVCIFLILPQTSVLMFGSEVGLLGFESWPRVIFSLCFLICKTGKWCCLLRSLGSLYTKMKYGKQWMSNVVVYKGKTGWLGCLGIVANWKVLAWKRQLLSCSHHSCLQERVPNVVRSSDL